MIFLITGSRGYIGSKLCQRMKEEKIEFVEFDSTIGNDILDVNELSRKSRGVDAIVHLAGVVGLDRCKKDPDGSYAVNVIGTNNVVLCGKPVIFAGALTGYSKKGIVDENTPVVAKSEYYTQKVLAENIVLHHFGIVLRLGSLYGTSPNMRWDLLVHSFVKESILNERIKLFQPEVMRPISNINDVCHAIMVFASNHALAENLSGVYNVVSANMKKVNIVKRISKMTGCNVEIVNETDPENRNYSVSTKKIRSLDFAFSPDLNKSIKEVMTEAKKDLCR